MVNDSLGHLFGDRLLQKVVDRLVTLVRAEDTVARLGGDEFIVLSDDLNKLDAIANIAAKLLDSFKPPFLLDEHEIHLGCSIGIALFPEDGNDGDQLIRAADTAMYRAKERGRNNYQYFSEEMATTAYDRLLMESALHSAIEQKELVVYYQPKINALTGKIVGAEALVRWVHPTLGFIPPIQFIPLAEESDLINQVGEFVLRTACSDAEMWRQSGYPLNNVAVNISVQQFVKQDLVSLVSTVLKECGMPAEMLELEITESALMRETERSLAMLVRLTELGAKIAIDDF
ncbi:EAL domain-containing protein [Candidatus Reidiella endopervernicosa]|nr:EAL domain-containing protein [Candidatus Reidiella endopervernicosa]